MTFSCEVLNAKREINDKVEVLLDDKDLGLKPLYLKNARCELLRSKTTGLVCLAISDCSAASSSISVCVDRGALNDDNDMKGTAHITEHLVFNGSKTYPEDRGYEKFITKHAGIYNAHTDYHVTNYHHSINKGHFEESIKRLLSNLTEPLLKPDEVIREIQTIDSEFQNTLRSNGRSIHLVERRFYKDEDDINEENSIMKFKSGNIATIRQNNRSDEEVVKKVREYFYSNYSISNMKMCLYSSHSMEELEGIFERSCDHAKHCETSNEAMKTRQLCPKATGTLPERKNKTRLMAVIHTSHHKHRLEYHYHFKHTSPCQGEFLTHLLKDKCEGSLYDVLKSKSLITSCKSKIHRHTESLSMLHLKLELTDTGIAHTHYVIFVMIMYFEFLKATQIPDGLLKEWYDKYKLTHIMTHKSNALHLVKVFARNMFNCKHAEDVIVGENYEKFSQEEELKLIKQLDFDKNGLIISHSNHHQQSSMKKYDEYCHRYYDEVQIEDFSKYEKEKFDFHLRRENKYLKACKTAVPEKQTFNPEQKCEEYDVKSLCNTKSIVAHSIVEKKYAANTQHSYIKICDDHQELVSEKEDQSMESHYTWKVITDCLKQKFALIRQDAKDARMSCKIRAESTGFSIRLEAFPELAQMLMEDIFYDHTCELSEEKIRVSVEKTIKSLRNKCFKAPHAILGCDFDNHLKFQHDFSETKNEQLVEKLRTGIDYRKVWQEFWKKKLSVVCVSLGESHEKNQKFLDILQEKIEKLETLEIQHKYVSSRERHDHQIAAKHCPYRFEDLVCHKQHPSDSKNNAILVVFSSRHASMHLYANIRLYCRLYAEKFCRVARDRECLGHVASMTPQMSKEGIHVKFLVQGQKTVEECKKAIFAFVDHTFDKLKEVSSPKFEKALEAECSYWQNHSASSCQDFDDILKCLDFNHYLLDQDNFECRSHVLKNLKTISKIEVLNETRRMFYGYDRLVKVVNLNKADA